MNRTPRGCSNIGGDGAAKLEYCRNRALQLFAFYGYRPFSPAELQLVEDVWNNISVARARRFIAVNSPFGEPCVLRGDLTLSAVTYLASHFSDDERPLRISYADRVFSAPQPPRHNLEENQVGLELIGWESAGTDVEVLSLLFHTLDELSIKRSVVVLGDVSVLSKFFEGLAPEIKKSLILALCDGALTEYRRLLAGSGASREKMKFLSALPELKGGLEIIDEAVSMLKNPAPLMPLKTLCDSLAKLGYGERLRIDLGFVRDLGYYSGPIFNAYSLDTGAALGGGGRYDELLTKFGMDGEAAGFGLNLKELASSCVDGSPKPQLMLWCGGSDPADALRYADGLYKKGISFELSWHNDREESLRIARLRGYRRWADYAAKKLVLLETGETRALTGEELEAF
jgi:ATP phosphoribosyltransferase regulatory subunit